MSEFQTRRLDSFIADGSVLLGRGDIISKEDIEAHPGPYPIYSSSAQGNGKFGEYGKFMFDEELITWSVDGGGYFFYRDKHRYSVTNVCGYMRIKSWKLHPKFVFYSLANQHRYQTFDYTTKAHPSVIQKLYCLPTIGYEQQKKIATILTGIDTAIEKTEALIAKYQQIKAGLMHDLFTRGVLPNGQLRPSREQAPELYQETAIGWIPREWELKPLGQLCDMTSGGTPSRSMPAYWGGSIPWVKTGEINYEDISRTEEYITPKGLSASSAKVFPAGTIVMAMYGEGVTRGRVAILAVPCASNQACIGFSFGNQIHIKYMYHFFEHCYEELRDLSNDGSQKNLSSGLLKQFQIRFPTSKAEQACIADRLCNLDQRIASEKEYLQNLCQQKLGLMHDLLTGKVTVKVEEPEVVDG